MKHLLKTFLALSLFAYSLLSTSCSPKADENTQAALQIATNNAAALDSIDQLLVVFNNKADSHQASLLALEKQDNKWVAKLKLMPAGIGRHGFAAINQKREGDGKSPTGIFSLGRLFCYEKNVDTQMPYTQTTDDDKWIDDPESDKYNQYVRGSTDAKSHENLKLSNDIYKYCMIIEYNTRPVKKAMGSAIFFHLGESVPGSTSGCVALNEADMQQVLKWLNPAQNPTMIMGNEQILTSGL